MGAWGPLNTHSFALLRLSLSLSVFPFACKFLHTIFSHTFSFFVSFSCCFFLSPPLFYFHSVLLYIFCMSLDLIALSFKVFFHTLSSNLPLLSSVNSCESLSFLFQCPVGFFNHNSFLSWIFFKIC